MKKLLLVAAAQCEGKDCARIAAPAKEKWEADFRQCHVRKWFSKAELADIGYPREQEGQTIVIEAEDVPELVKAFRVIKKCTAFLQCLDDREHGKVKHCYANDKRWR
jgi:hypothetical protein